VRPGKPIQLPIKEGRILLFTSACLGERILKDERAVLKMKVDDGPEMTVCTLLPFVCENVVLDLPLVGESVTFSVVSAKKTSVHLLGRYTVDEEDDDEGGEYFMDGMDEEDSDDEDYVGAEGESSDEESETMNGRVEIKELPDDDVDENDNNEQADSSESSGDEPQQDGSDSEESSEEEPPAKKRRTTPEPAKKVAKLSTTPAKVEGKVSPESVAQVLSSWAPIPLSDCGNKISSEFKCGFKNLGVGSSSLKTFVTQQCPHLEIVQGVITPKKK